MHPTQILKILPRLPPAICGVGDHATGIGAQLSNFHGCDVSYLGVNAADPGGPVASNELPERSAEALLSALSDLELRHDAVIVLHFSGYSFGKKGVCAWLPKALKAFRKQRPTVRLSTMFHELWSPAKLVSRSGWIVPFQKQIIKQLVRLSDVVRTNRASYRSQIERLCPEVAGRVRVKNICSNFGEPAGLEVASKRAKQILIFQPPCLDSHGGSFYWKQWSMLQEQLGGIPTIVAGRTGRLPSDDRIQEIGFVSVEDGSRLMSESQYAFFEYFEGYIGKSSLFGSLAAHGMVPIMPRVNKSDDENLFYGKHYLVPGDHAIVEEFELNRVSRELSEWYRGHSIASTSLDYLDSFVQSNRNCA